MDRLTGILANCVDCGYDLRGQQDEPRCPECGRLNIPEAYRREVHELVDSGRWFFSNPFSLFAKRPPGWFWSLDRPGDVRRSLRRAGMYVALSAAVIVLSIALADACRLTLCETVVFPAFQVNADTGRPERIPQAVRVHRFEWHVGAFGLKTHATDSKPPFGTVVPVAEAPTPNVATRLSLVPTVSLELIKVTVALVVFLFGTWVLPAGVGLWTQVRKGLPGFARASSTVIAACNYEAHRLIYAAALCAMLMAADTIIRAYTGTTLFGGGPLMAFNYTVFMIYTVLIIVPSYAALGWIGLLRSDFTRQIVRSPWHAARITWMYAILLAAVFSLCVVLLL